MAVPEEREDGEEPKWSDVRPEGNLGFSASLKAAGMPFYDEQRALEFNFIYRVLALSAKVTLANVSGVPTWDLILREKNRKELNYNGVDIERFGR